MPLYRAKIYQSKAELCRHQADLPQNASEKQRWLKVANEWSKLADQAKRDPARIRRFRWAKARIARVS